MTRLTACIQGISVLGPGLADWPGAAAVLAAEAPYVPARTLLPAPTVLPPAERRRAGRVIRLALAIGAEALASAGVDARTLSTVFTSSGGDGDNCHEICAALAAPERLISPTRFTNSVHNAASGYWSIAYGCRCASTSLCASDASFGAGLLEALSQIACGASAVLLLAYDADYPPPLRAQRNIPDAFGTALLLLPSGAPAALAQIHVSVSDAAPSTLRDAGLEALRISIPAARSLPMLEYLAKRARGTVVLDYLHDMRLAVEVQA
jgi:beta-ketoacyl synthase-like protein